MRFRHIATLLLVLASGSIEACSQLAAAEPHEPPASLVPVPGTDHHRITLTARAAERIGIETVPAVAGPDGSTSVVPYSSVLYDADGKTFVYVSPAALAYVREDVELVHIEADQAFYTVGPAVGTAVVSIGAAELLGTESEIGH